MVRDNTAAGLSTQSKTELDTVIEPFDRQILRHLAGEVAELAVRPLEKEKEKLWYKLNALEETRPLVFCDPENGWNEILTDRDLGCRGKLARDWEYLLRKEIWWASKMNDDRVTTGIFNIGYVYSESDWGMHEIKHGGERGGSYRWEAPLKDLDDLSKLHYPAIEVNYPATDRLFNLANEIMGDLLTVRKWNMWWWTLGLTWTLINLRGLEQIMFDMYDHPEGLHKLMAFLRDGTLAKLDFLEKNHLLPTNHRGDYVGSGGFGWTKELPQPDFNGSARTKDMWGFGESQETSLVHPDMFAEFVYQYQAPILERFGLNCYGCCEPLHKRWHVVKQTPRLRRVSVSPWCDVAAIADQLKDEYVLSLKPHPGKLAVKDFDEEEVRGEIRGKLAQAKGCRVEIIMKDNNTIANNPQHVIDWVRIAKEEAEIF